MLTPFYENAEYEEIPCIGNVKVEEPVAERAGDRKGAKAKSIKAKFGDELDPFETDLLLNVCGPVWAICFLPEHLTPTTKSRLSSISKSESKPPVESEYAQNVSAFTTSVCSYSGCKDRKEQTTAVPTDPPILGNNIIDSSKFNKDIKVHAKVDVREDIIEVVKEEVEEEVEKVDPALCESDWRDLFAIDRYLAVGVSRVGWMTQQVMYKVQYSTQYSIV